MSLTLETAKMIVDAVFAHAHASGFPPLAAAVLDARGALKAFEAQDGTSLKRGEIAIGKAHGVIALGMGGRALADRAEQQPYFVAAVSHVVGGSLIPVRGGVLLKDERGATIGAIGVSGAASDQDEACALAAAESAGLTAIP